MVSTPNNPGGLFEQIENESPDQCLYYRMFLDYRLGLGTIYSISDIDRAKQSPSFEREYDLKSLVQRTSFLFLSLPLKPLLF
jgi:hypothetical protein